MKFNETTEDEKYEILTKCARTNTDKEIKDTMKNYNIDQTEFKTVFKAMEEFIEDQNNQNELDRIRGK